MSRGRAIRDFEVFRVVPSESCKLSLPRLSGCSPSLTLHWLQSKSCDPSSALAFRDSDNFRVVPSEIAIQTVRLKIRCIHCISEVKIRSTRSESYPAPPSGALSRCDSYRALGSRAGGGGPGRGGGPAGEEGKGGADGDRVVGHEVGRRRHLLPPPPPPDGWSVHMPP